MTFVDAIDVSGRKTGQIKLHGPEAFEGMRKAGRLTAEALDMLAPFVKPGVTTEFLDNLVFDSRLRITPILRRSITAAIASRSAPRSTMSSATVFRTGNRCATATLSTSMSP